MSFKILIADDDSKIGRLLHDVVKKQGYTPLVAENGQQALDLFFEHSDISLCILDVMMPIYTGLEVLQTIREHSQVPVMLLTALGEEVHELKGFRSGADDYVAKPFSLGILMARIENLLKKEILTQEQPLEQGEVKLDLKGYRTWVHGEEVALNNKEFALLTLFMEHEGQVLSREQLLNKIWGYDYEGEIRTVDTHIKMLRKKLEDCGEYIQTIRGVGYKFVVV